MVKLHPRALLALTLGFAVAVCATQSARADVSIGLRKITVTTPGARATIARLPFGISFATGDGRTALSEMPTTSDTPPVGRPVPSPGIGNFPPTQSTLYAPLVFTVGTVNTKTIGWGPWLGNLESNARAGTLYSARRVETAFRFRDGVRMQVATTDPSARKLIVTVAPDGVGAIHVEAAARPSTGVIAVADSFRSGVDEGFRGFGGRHNALDQRGNNFYSWTEEENIDPGFLSPGGTHLIPNGPTAAYYPLAEFISSRPYGFLLDRPELGRFRLAADRPDAWQADVEAPALAYSVAPGNASQAIDTLTAISGRHRVPEDWMLGPMLDRLAKLGDTAATYEAAVRDDLTNIDRYNLPLKAYRLEGAAILPTAVLRDLIDELHSRGTKALVYFRAYVGTDAAATEEPGLLNYAIQHGYVARRPNGSAYTFLSPTIGLGALIDFTNPQAVDWWQGRIRAMLDLGADGFMQDFSEQVVLDMRFHNGETGLTMHNQYPALYHRVTREAVERYEQSHPDRRIWFFTRAGNSGRPGSAAYENANFPGDETTDWTHSSGIKSVVPDMLNRAVGGAVGYGTDIGGYTDFTTPATSKELFLRWAELAALTPVFRLHGSVGHGTHTPWSYDQETVDIYNRLSELHLRAAPLMLRLWRQFARTGMPVTRPLWLGFPDDREAARQDQEWLLGPDVLVAPVVEQGALTRSAYFPAGCWRDPETGDRYFGPRSATVAAPLAKLPYFFRCGTDPFSPPDQSR